MEVVQDWVLEGHVYVPIAGTVNRTEEANLVTSGSVPNVVNP